MLDIENLRINELLSYQFTVESSDRHKVGLHKWTLVYLVRPASNRGKTLNIEVRFMSPPPPPKGIGLSLVITVGRINFLALNKLSYLFLASY